MLLDDLRGDIEAQQEVAALGALLRRVRAGCWAQSLLAARRGLEGLAAHDDLRLLRGTLDGECDGAAAGRVLEGGRDEITEHLVDAEGVPAALQRRWSIQQQL